MKRIRSLIIGGSLVLSFPLLAIAEPAPAPADKEKVQALVKEFQQQVTDAASAFRDSRQIIVTDELTSPHAIVYPPQEKTKGVPMNAEQREAAVKKTVAAMVEESKNSKKFSDNLKITRRIEYYRGYDATYRVEFSPLIKSEEIDGVVREGLVDLSRIAYHGVNGKTSVRDFNPGLAANGDILEQKSLRESTEPSKRSQEVARGYDFGPDYIITVRGVPWDGYFEPDLKAMEWGNRTEIPDGAKTFQFLMHNAAGDAVRYDFDFGNYRGVRLPKRYECRIGDKVHEAQTWEYVQKDGHIVSAKSTYKYPSSIPDVETTIVLAYEFSNDRPELNADDFNADHPLSEKMQALFAKGREVQIKRASESSGIKLSGKTVDPLAESRIK